MSAACGCATARPSGAEAQLSFAALIDLCDGLEHRRAPGSAAHRARGRAPATRAGSRAAGAARDRARVAPRHWPRTPRSWSRSTIFSGSTAPSADALAFAARRLAAEPVGFLLARRPGTASVLEQALERARARGRRAERERHAPPARRAARPARCPRRCCRRIVDATLGNPLFALEVGRVLAEHGLPDADADLPVPAAVEDMLGTRVAGLPRPARRLLLATALSEGLHVDALEAIGDAAAVEDALNTGLFARRRRPRGTRLIPCWPAAAHRQHAAPEATARTPRRARRRGPRAGKARAASGTRRGSSPMPCSPPRWKRPPRTRPARGARPEAVALAEQALRLTPAQDSGAPSGCSRSRATGARGRAAAVEGRADARVGSLPAERAYEPGCCCRSRPVLARGREALLEPRSRRAGDELALRGRVLALKALTTAAEGVERIHDAEGWALEAFPAGPGADCLALRVLGWTRSLGGLPVDDVDEQLPRDHRSRRRASGRFPRAGRGAGAGVAGGDRSGARRDDRLPRRRRRARRGRRARVAEAEPVRARGRAGEWDAAARMLDEWAASDADSS